MRKFFDSELTIIVNSGFIYFPLLFDASIEQDVGSIQNSFAIPTEPSAPLRTSIGSKLLIQSKGKLYVKGLSLRALSESYPKLFPDAYQQLRSSCLERYLQTLERAEISIDSKLEAILFHILPHFMRRTNRLRRGKPSTEEVLDLINEAISIPEEFYEQAEKFLNIGGLERAIDDLGSSKASRPLIDGHVSGRELHEWLQEEVTARIFNEEREALSVLIQERERYIPFHRRYIATLLFIADRGSFEKDGAGFYWDGKLKDYIIYKHTGEYALKDYFGRIYLFPDCRVAVRTHGYLRPVILERYKHPFLKTQTSRQEICVGGSAGDPPVEFSAGNAIRVIEEGINALFYGYNSRQHNGHHSLDRNTTYFRPVDFDDFLIPEDHPKILSGEVEVKNAFK